MINIGPAQLWDIIIFSILAIGLICGIFVRTAASTYFLVGNIVVIGFIFLFKPPIIKAIAQTMESSLEDILSGEKVRTISPIFTTLIGEVILFVGIFLICNILFFVIYVSFLRKYFRLLRFNSIFDRITGGFVSVATMGIFAFMLSNLVSSSLFYTSRNYDFSQPVITSLSSSLDNDVEKHKNEYQTSAWSAKMFSFLPETNVHKKGDSIAYLFWFANDLKNKNDNVEDLVNMISQPNDFIPSLKVALDNVTEEQKHKIINKMLDPLVNAIKDKDVPEEPDDKVAWSSINETLEKWKQNNANQSLTGSSIQEMMNSDNPDYKVFKDLKEILDKNADDNVAKMINSGDKIYGIFKNLSSLNNLVSEPISALDTINNYINRYIDGLVISKPQSGDSEKMQNYEQFRHWFN